MRYLQEIYKTLFSILNSMNAYLLLLKYRRGNRSKPPSPARNDKKSTHNVNPIDFFINFVA